MIGVKTRFVISPKFLLGVYYNAGGFGLGDSSKFAHDFTYINSFKVHRHLLVNAGFRGFRYRRVDGEGEEEGGTKKVKLGNKAQVSKLKRMFFFRDIRITLRERLEECPEAVLGLQHVH